MSNEYGQQPYPGNQSPVPGFGPPQYPDQNQAQYPAPGQQYGYPQTPPGGQPMYPAGPGGYGQPFNVRPGSLTGAAVLGFVQAAVTLITTGIFFSALFGSASVQDSSAAIAWGLASAQLAGLILLIFGSVQLLSGTSRALYIVGVVLELLICAYYLVTLLAIDTSGTMFPEVVRDFKAAAAVVPVIFAIMPLIGLILVLGSTAGNYIAGNQRR